jgi:hypothetical protein
MINPADLLNDLVAALQDIPALVIELGGDPDVHDPDVPEAPDEAAAAPALDAAAKARIYAYHDTYPARSSLVHAIHAMPTPSIMVAWQGTSPGTFGAMDVWKINVTLFIRAKESGNYYAMFRQIAKGTPTAIGQPMLNATIHAGCYPMDIPSCQRQTDAEGLDYFEVPLSFTEIGDD